MMLCYSGKKAIFIILDFILVLPLMNASFFPVWLPPILLSALFLGLYDVAKKHAVNGNPVLPVLFWSNLFGAIFLLLAFACTGTLGAALACTPREYALIAVKALIAGGSWYFVFAAMRELPISVAGPVSASGPLWVFLGGVLVFHEAPTRWQLLAMVLVFAGYLLFASFGKLDRIDWLHSRGIRALFLGMLISALSALYDKYLMNVLRLDFQKVQCYFALNLVPVLGLAAAASGLRRRGRVRVFRPRWSLLATGFFLIAADFCYFYTLTLPEVQISVLSLTRRSSCVVSFVVGTWLFRERFPGRKAGALALILLGVALLALGR